MVPMSDIGEDEVRAAGLDDWTVCDGELRATFATGDFATGLRLVAALGERAEAANHHPDVTLTYPSVSLSLLSHDVGHLTQRDLDLAREVSAEAARLGVAAQRD